MLTSPQQPTVYLLASRRCGTLYIGVTSDLILRVAEHKTGIHKGFTKKYGVYLLVYYECFVAMGDAIAREKQLKNWKRQWKIDLIERENPEWRDLFLR